MFYRLQPANTPLLHGIILIIHGIIINYYELLRISNILLALHGQQCGAVAENIQPNTVALLAGQREGLLAS